MKKVLFIAVIAMLGLGKVSAQEITYGATVGFHNLGVNVKGFGESDSDSASGYYVGFFAEFKILEKFSVQPEIHFASVIEDSESTNELIIPIMAKYYVSEKFNIQAGPQLDFLLEDTEGINKFGLGLALGAGYDVTEKIFVATRYSFGVSNRISDAPSGISSKFNTFQIGVGYKF
jgi:opacity protein-like surface antigen